MVLKTVLLGPMSRKVKQAQIGELRQMLDVISHTVLRHDNQLESCATAGSDFSIHSLACAVQPAIERARNRQLGL